MLGMTSTDDVQVRASADAVYAVVADGWSYAAWVVGASHIRAVDPAWPTPGTSIHHSLGAWPVLIKDTTSVVHLEPGREIELEVRVWAIGRGRVRLTITPNGEQACRVQMREQVQHRLAGALPDAVLDPLLSVRNRETLQRLAALAEKRSRPQT